MLTVCISGTFFVTPVAQASHVKLDVQGFVKIREGQELYVEYIKPDPGKPVLVILNGLTYSVRSWDPMMKPLLKVAKSGYGILRYDPRGMGQTLLKYAPVQEAIPIDSQVADLDVLLDVLGIRQPVTLAGLSYGGGFAVAYSARHPERVEKMILMAPYTEPMASQDSYIRTQIAMTRAMYPFNPLTDDELYDFYLRNIVYTTYPSAEPVVLENPFKLEATFRLAVGIRKFLAEQVVSLLPRGSVHLVRADKDQYIEATVHEKFWQVIPQDVRASWITLKYSEHKIPEAYPEFAAAWINQVMENNPMISEGRKFVGDPVKWTVQGDGTSVSVPKIRD